MRRRLLRHQELVGVDEGHPAERPAEVRGGMRIGQHLVVDLAPEPGVGEDLPPRHDRARRFRQRLAQDGERAVAPAVVVDQEAPHPGSEVERGPFADMPRLVPDDQRHRDPFAPGLGLRRDDADLADLAERRQLPEHPGNLARPPPAGQSHPPGRQVVRKSLRGRP